MTGRSTLLACFLVIAFFCDGHCSPLKVSGVLRSLSKKVMNLDFDSVNVAIAGPQFGGYAVGGGYVAYRSSVVSSLSQLDRGDKDAALETLRVAIASLALGTTQTFGLPIFSEVIDKVFNKYGRLFPKTVEGFTNYNKELGKAIIDQVSNVAAPAQMSKGDEILDVLDTLKEQLRDDFTKEVQSFLKNSQGFEDLVEPLKTAKSWAKVAKWADFLLGPIFDAANIAFTGWQLDGAIKSGDQLAVASGSIGIVGSIVGIGSFVVGSLATAGSILAAAAGPVGALIGCILTLASLIIDVINEYNPRNKINEHLELVKQLTQASKDMVDGVHYNILQKATENGIQGGFNELYDVNQAMLIEARAEDEFDTIKGFKDYNNRTLDFNYQNVYLEDDGGLVVGTKRVFDKKYYQNWLFKPVGTEEIGYSYYGKVVLEDAGGITVRLNTDMVTNKDTHMWFWLNGAKIKTFKRREESVEADDNISIGDFRTLLPTSSTDIIVETGGGNDLLQITGVICAEEKQVLMQGRCLGGNMGEGYDTVSFEGMDKTLDKRKWFMENGDLSKTKLVVGVSFDMRNGELKYKVRGDGEEITEKKFGTLNSVEGFIGSPLNDLVFFDDSQDYSIKQYSGKNEYRLYISNKREERQYVIEDNSDQAGKLIIYNEGLTWSNVVFSTRTKIILIVFGDKGTSQIFIKRSKPGLEDFKVRVNEGSTKTISSMGAISERKDVLLPYVPYPYHFNKNLVGRINQRTYVELLVPEGDYPERAKTHRIKFVYPFSELLLSDELLDTLEAETYSLTATREGSAEADGSWTVYLRKPGSNGGWKLKIGQIGIFSVGVPGYTQSICNLAQEVKQEVDVFLFYKVIMQKSVYDSTANFYGSEGPDKLLFKFPAAEYDGTIHTYVIDLKGPHNPTPTNRNEMVFKDSFTKRIRGIWRSDIHLELTRESMQADWHLRFRVVYRSTKIVVIDITLKNVHAFITGQQYGWKTVLDLASSRETSHDLKDRLIVHTGGYLGPA